MKVIARKTWRPRNLLVMMPLVLIVILTMATSGPVSSGAADATYLPPVPPPVPGFWPAPTPPAFAGLLTVGEVDALLADNNNHGHTDGTPNVHMIDVRSSFEYQADVCPMQIALGLPIYTVTNVGHPVWTWPDGTYEEAYADPYWIGFWWAGTPYASMWNLRMEENPNFGQYLEALVAEGTIKKNDKLIFLCQTAYRASWAAAEATSLGFTDVNVMYGGMLAWEDDWYWDDNQYCDNLSTDPSPNDLGDGRNCDPDNTPGPNARSKTTILSDPYKYNPARLTAAGYTPYWNGTEPHVGVKPEWMIGMGAGDFQLSARGGNVYWASLDDYTNRLLSVDFQIVNNPPAPPGPMNYPAACGGAPPPDGSCEQVYQDPHGTAYNSQIVAAPATNGVVATGLPALAGDIAPNAAGSLTIKFNVPEGVTFFRTYLYAVATDVPDPEAVYGTGNGWYGTYQYPGPAPTP